MPAPKPHIDDLFVNGKVASWFIPYGLIHSGGHAVCTIRLRGFQGGELANFKMMIKKICHNNLVQFHSCIMSLSTIFLPFGESLPPSCQTGGLGINPCYWLKSINKK